MKMIYITNENAYIGICFSIREGVGRGCAVLILRACPKITLAFVSRGVGLKKEPRI